MLRVGGAFGNNLIQSYTGGGSTAIGLWSGGLPRLYSTGDMYFSVGATVGTGAPSAFTDAMTITSAGNLLVGATSGGQRLVLKGGDTNTAMYLENGATSVGYIGAAKGYNAGFSGTDLIIGGYSNNTIFANSATERMRIDSSGNVGIGTSSPATLLHISATNPEFRLQGTNGTGNIHKIRSTGLNSESLQITSATDIFYNGNSHVFRAANEATEYFRITSTGGITSANLADAVGYKGVPQNSQTSAYTLALSDIGKHISITTGGVVVPANGSVAFPIGSTVVIYNNSASNQTISITTDTMYLAGTATTGSRTLAQRGLATCVKVAATTWVISGAGLT
jgi:hypothetical protein